MEFSPIEKLAELAKDQRQRLCINWSAAGYYVIGVGSETYSCLSDISDEELLRAYLYISASFINKIGGALAAPK